MVSGCDIELEETPSQEYAPRPYKFPEEKDAQITLEIKELLSKGVIEPIQSNQAAFVSNIFTRTKTDGKLRVILDLTKLNEVVTYKHFKMDNLQTAIDLLTPNCFMASIDWKDAYYSVPIAKNMRKYLTFVWQGQTYQFTCLPNGLACAPRYFTKLSKVLFSELRKKGHVSTTYIDDCLVLSNTYEQCKQNIDDTVDLSRRAGFMIHPLKSILTPTQKIVYLGFWLDSTKMTVKLTAEKATKVRDACTWLLQARTLTIRELTKVIGLLVSSFPGVKHGQLFYRRCENHKTKALKENKGRFDAKITLPNTCTEDLEWWVNNIETEEKTITNPKPSMVIETDASNKGWGACVKGKRELTTGGHWSVEESQEHINYLELLAVWFGIKCFAKGKRGTHIKILSDNTTTVAYLNKQGGTKHKCNSITRVIWMWCYENEIWLSAAHIPGKDNIQADSESRSNHDNMEWKLNPQNFGDICKTFGTPQIDLFASRLNCQIDRYFSWKPDPHALAIDAMSETWDEFFYAFPPFNMIGRVLRKIELEGSHGVVVVPKWTTQTWWPRFTRMCTKPPLVLCRKKGQQLLYHHWREESELPNTSFVAGLM
jgi:hypothetical protein